MASVIFFNGANFSTSGGPNPEVDIPGLQGEPNKNIEITCYPQWYTQMNLEWAIPASWGNCKFNVFFSPHENGDFTQLNEEMLINPYFRDGSSVEYSKIRHGYYVVEAIIQSTGQHVYSHPTTWATKSRSFLQKRVSEIQRREYMLLTKFTGVKSFLFRRKPYGDRCPRCWNEVTEKVMDDHCPVCYGTSYDGGFFDPVVIYVQYEPTPNEVMMNFFGPFEPNQIGAWTIAIPYMGAGDILIRSGDWNVYYVSKTTSTELQTNGVRQLLTLTQLAKADVENLLISKTEAPPRYLQPLGGDFSQTRFPPRMVDQVPTNDHAWSPGAYKQTLPMPFATTGTSPDDGSGGGVILPV